MSSLVNQVQLIGRLGADAEVKIVNKGAKVSTFSLATNEITRQSKEERKEITLWHNCVVWGELNQVVEKYGKKGVQVMVQGALNYREYEDTNGIKRYITEIKVESLLVLSFAKYNEAIENDKTITHETDLPK